MGLISILLVAYLKLAGFTDWLIPIYRRISWTPVNRCIDHRILFVSCDGVNHPLQRATRPRSTVKCIQKHLSAIPKHWIQNDVVAPFVIYDQISRRDLILLIYHHYSILGPNIMRSKGIIGCAASLLLATTVSAAQITKNLSKSETQTERWWNISKVFVNKFLEQMQRISLTGQFMSTTCAGMIPTSTYGTLTMDLGQLASRRGI